MRHRRTSLLRRGQGGAAPPAGDARKTPVALIVLAAFGIICLLTGGSSRADGGGELIAFLLRPVAVLSLTALLLLPGPYDWRAVRAPLLLLVALTVAIAVQLIPLPPAIWIALPGHARFAEAAAAAGLPQPWRPISMAPELTLNSLMALVVPATVLVGIARLPRSAFDKLVPWTIGAIFFSAMLGVLQWAGPFNGPLQLYTRANLDLPVGLLANRNHQALFLAMALPLLRVWAASPGTLVREQGVRVGLAALLGVFLFPVILATGSRTGLAIALVALTGTWFVAPVRPRTQRLSRTQLALLALGAAGLVALCAAVVLSGRAVSVNRLLEVHDANSELRVRFTPLTLRITGDFFPFGTGFGTFDRAFRLYEPLAFLKRTYFNHAHNDVLELVMTGGIPALLVLVALVVWTIKRLAAVVADRRAGRDTGTTRLNLTGLVLMLLCFIGSVPDYPLRAPIMAMMFALACTLAALTQRSASDTAIRRSRA